MNRISISIESPLTDDADWLISGSEAALRAVYTEDECFTFTASELDANNIDFFVARAGGKPVGCVALVRLDKYAEVKRLYVPEASRGLGLAVKLMAALETHVLASGIKMVRLETGDKLSAAVSLYKRLGYNVCSRFGEYEDHPASLFMEKELA